MTEDEVRAYYAAHSKRLRDKGEPVKKNWRERLRGTVRRRFLSKVERG